MQSPRKKEKEYQERIKRLGSASEFPSIQSIPPQLGKLAVLQGDASRIVSFIELQRNLIHFQGYKKPN